MKEYVYELPLVVVVLPLVVVVDGDLRLKVDGCVSWSLFFPLQLKDVEMPGTTSTKMFLT